jgi:hypothetical protein
MSAKEQEKRQARAMLYAIALLHLLCLGLMKESPSVLGGSQYAMRAVDFLSRTGPL